jgi:hypothetical protein
LLEYTTRVRGRVVPFADIKRHLDGQPFNVDFEREYSQRTLQRLLRHTKKKSG